MQGAMQGYSRVTPWLMQGGYRACRGPCRGIAESHPGFPRVPCPPQVSYTLTSLNVAHNAIAEAGGLAIATALHLNSTLASLCLAGLHGGGVWGMHSRVNSTLASLCLAGLPRGPGLGPG